jgi:hypothetical protein
MSMKQRRHSSRVRSAKVVAVRFAAVAVTTGVVAMGALVAPVQADTGWNRQIVPTRPSNP